MNALGYECTTSPTDIWSDLVSSPTDEFGSFQTYQTVFLVLSNLFLLIPAYKAFLQKNYTIFGLNILSSSTSSLYHACKSSSGGVCLLNFCTLKNLDYASSTTLLISFIFFILPFVIEEDEEEPNGFGNKVIKEYKFIEGILLVSYFLGIFIILDSTFMCSGKYTMIFFLITIGSAFLIALVGHFVIVRQVDVKSFAPYNIPNLIIGTTLLIIAIVFFVIEDYTSKELYWLTHGLWHITGALSEPFFLDVRSKTRTACASLCFCCNFTIFKTSNKII
jgi:hypothetical protein